MRIVFMGNFATPWNSESYYARTLESLGHQVTCFHDDPNLVNAQVQEAARTCDLFVWLHWPGTSHGTDPSMLDVVRELRERDVPVVAYHSDLFTDLPRGDDFRADPAYRLFSHFFGADPQAAAWFNAETRVSGHYLPSGVFKGECAMVPRTQTPDGQPMHDVAFVGSRSYHDSWPYRPQVIDWLGATYGERFTHIGHDGVGLKYGLDLNQIMADTKVVVGDSLCPGFDSPGYWSDRVYELTGRGAFLIHPYVQGLEEHFQDGVHLRFYTYGDFDELRSLIDYYLVHDQEREAIRTAGFQHTREHHTYTNRWETILDRVTG